jgi:hypothetical protein
VDQAGEWNWSDDVCTRPKEANEMKTLSRIGLVLVILFAVLTVPTAAQATVVEKTNEVIPLDLWVWVPCALDGAGEYVHLTGELHIVTHIWIDANGGFHAKIHYQPQHLSGYGESSGLRYQGTGVTQSNEKIAGDGLPYVYTYTNNYRMVGQGPGNNYTVHETFHVTINANGEATSEVTNITIDCK